MRPVEAFRHQAQACAELGSPMYAELLDHLADDLDAGGPTATLIARHEDDPGPSALALRLLGSVHRLVLAGRAGPLAAHYPSVGGTWAPDEGVVAFTALLEREPDAVREWLDRPPQTNEVGRSAALMGGLLHLHTKDRVRPVRLFEIGSSGGLNLLADQFEYVDDSGAVFGRRRSPVRLEPAWSAAPLARWSGLRFAQRSGCDLMPVDVSTTEGGITLSAYVWPDQAHRLERLRGALALARDHPPVVRRIGAADFVERLTLHNGATTVLWHSVMWQYLPDEERARVTRRVQDLGELATDAQRFVHLFLEPMRRTPEAEHEFLVVMTTWPGGEHRILGRAAPHGLPVTWEADAI